MHIQSQTANYLHSYRCVLLAVMSGTVPDITASNTHLQEDTGIT